MAILCDNSKNKKLEVFPLLWAKEIFLHPLKTIQLSFSGPQNKSESKIFSQLEIFPGCFELLLELLYSSLYIVPGKLVNVPSQAILKKIACQCSYDERKSIKINFSTFL